MYFLSIYVDIKIQNGVRWLWLWKRYSFLHEEGLNFGGYRVYLCTQIQLFTALCECVCVVNIECWVGGHRRRDEEETSCCCCHICIIWRRNLLTPQLIYGRANSAQLTLSGANHLLHLYSLHPRYIIMNIMYILYASYYLSMDYTSASTCCRVRMYIDHISLALNY